ncbi:MAG: 16S rRNA (cytosine(1402)-N(4))-methyltransferase RsmH [Anaerolineaceae bacterium]
MDQGLAANPLHQPVLFHQILDYLSPSSPFHYLDCTSGAGGHSRGILEACTPEGELLSLDLDPSAIALTQAALAEFGKKAHVVHGSYLNARSYLAELGWEGVAGIVMDLGVSSMQLDQPERGFSFRYDAPLDMRFDPSRGRTAADLVNHSDEQELADLIWRFGEERFSRRIARSIVNARPVLTTFELAKIVRSAVGHTKERQDQATRTFQALRIAINEELVTIERAIPELIDLLQPKGRLTIISFHSLEDRLVKQAFRLASQDCICPPEQPVCTCDHQATVKVLTAHPVLPTKAEMDQNPRARSAKLRVVEKITFGTKTAGS